MTQNVLKIVSIGLFPCSHNLGYVHFLHSPVVASRKNLMEASRSNHFPSNSLQGLTPESKIRVPLVVAQSLVLSQ